ncbi:MAG: hypothetical protein IKO15_08865 [Clostridiales bacterium]|nr:hypothetical protein [Clostridiales bacterium]
MFYNKDNPQWQFNEEQFLSRDEYYRMVGEYDELFKSMLTADVRDFGSKFYGVKETGTPEQQEAKRKKAIFGIICIIIVFASLVVSLILKQLVIFGYIACAVFLIFGISMIISGKGDVVESTSRAVINRVIGAGMALASIAILLLIVFRNSLVEAEFFLMLFVIVFGVSGLVLLVCSIMRALSGKLIYTEEINATCSGYVRYVDRDSSENGRSFVFIHASPLFTYSYEGVQYESVWDEFPAKEDLDIALGQSVPVKIDPRHPENVMSPATAHPGSLVFMIVMSLLCVGVGVGLGIYLTTGAAKGMTVETQWNPLIEEINGETGDSRTKVTDDQIKSLYLDKFNITSEWYYEMVTVATMNYTADGQVITFTDEAFNSILYTDGTAPKPGTVMMIFYTVDEEYVESGGIYKHSFASGDPEKFVYVGSHGAYVAN